MVKATLPSKNEAWGFYSTMTTLEFFIERRGNTFVLVDADDELHVPTLFPDENIAAEAAIRFAQDQDALYALYYNAPSHH